MIEELRKGCNTLHKELEGQLYGQKIMQKTLTQTELCHLLHINYLFFTAAEAILHGYDEFAGFRFEKAHLALHDLQQLGFKPTLDVPSIPLETSGKEPVVGLLYVTLGSSLGGALIAKKLERTPHIPHERLKFFQASPAMHYLWKKYLNYLESDVDRGSQEAVVNSAQIGFRHFQDLYEYTK